MSQLIPDFRASSRRPSGLRVKSPFAFLLSPVSLFTFPITLVFSLLNIAFNLVLSPFGYSRRNAFRLWSAFSPVASVICMGVLAMLIFFPSVADSNHGVLSGSIGYIAFASAITGLLSSCFRSLRYFGVTIFWVFATCTIGRYVFTAPQQSSPVDRYEARAQRTIQLEDLQFDDIPELKSFDQLGNGSSLTSGLSGYRVNLDKFSPSNLIGKFYDGVEAEIDNRMAATKQKIAGSIYEPVNGVMRDLKIDKLLPGAPTMDSLSFSSSGGLPDSAYFPTQNLKGRKFYGSGPAQDGGIQEQILGFLGVK